jgi:hypothetical protein
MNAAEADDQRTESLVGRVVGAYRVEALLGDGGMAQVYRARHLHLESVHALKVLDPRLLVHADLRDRFLDEGRIQARLRHPAIVAVTDVVAEPGVAALVMEYVEGPTLAAWLEAQPVPPPLELLQRLFLQVLDGLGHAHERRIVHRDIKPGNVLLALEDGRPAQAKLLDFGIAKVEAEGKARTRADARMGTPWYMSPEQILDARRVDARSDLFSLGVTLYECATKGLPFEGETEFDVQRAIVDGKWVPARRRLPSIDPDFEAVLERALRREPAERFSSCAEFAGALRAVATGPRSPAAPAPVAPFPPAPSVSVAGPPAEAAPAAPAVPGDAFRGRWLAIGAVAICIGGAGVLLSTLLADGRGAVVARPSSSERAPDAPVPSSAAAVSAPLAYSVEASSELRPWRGYTFWAGNVADGRLDTSWQPVDHRMVGESLLFSFGAPRTLDAIEVANGLQRQDALGDLFLNNARVRVAYVEMDDGIRFTMRFGQFERGLVRLDLEGRRTSSVRLTVMDVHAGRQWPDLAVSEVRFLGR